MIDAVAHTSRLLIIALSAVCLSGCQTMRGMLKPYVCDCAQGASAKNCPAEPQGDSTPSALAVSQQATTTAVERAVAEARLASESDTPSLRTLERRAAKEPPKDPLELIDAGVDEAAVDLSDHARTEQIQQTFGIALDEKDAVVFTGNFSTQPGPELVIIRPGKELEVYGTDSRIGRLEMRGAAAPSAFVELGVAAAKTAPRVVRLVQDGTLQVMLHWREESEAGAFAYKVGVFKVIGPYVGRVFERTLAVSPSEEGELSRLGTYEVLRGDAHRFLRWIPAGDSGELLTDQADILRWNRWEGVYRVPRPAPTAPKKDELHSTAPAGLEAPELAWH